MSLAEKKQSLLYIIEDADEKLTGLLIALATEYTHPEKNIHRKKLKVFIKSGMN